MKRMTHEEFYKAKAEAEKKGQRCQEFIEKDYVKAKIYSELNKLMTLVFFARLC